MTFSINEDKHLTEKLPQQVQKRIQGHVYALNIIRLLCLLGKLSRYVKKLVIVAGQVYIQMSIFHKLVNHYWGIPLDQEFPFSNNKFGRAVTMFTKALSFLQNWRKNENTCCLKLVPIRLNWKKKK